MHPALYVLRDAFRAYAASEAPDIAAFCGVDLMADHPVRPLEITTLPFVRHLNDIAAQTEPATHSIVEAVLEAAPHLHWRQSYSEVDPGFDAEYLARYGWFNLIAPSGPFVSDSLRVSVGYWGKGLHYPRHWHEPEEIYLTLAGEARYISEGRADVVGGPGTTICHRSNQPHAATMEIAPLLAAAFWRGTSLEAKPDLPSRITE